LKVGDWTRAIEGLVQEKLIADTRDGAFIALAPGVGTEVVVRRLVEQGMPVFEIAHEEQTLEHFYLSLMKEERSESKKIGTLPAR
jgi:hypothetical protein